MKILLDLPTELNEKVKLEKVVKKDKNMEETIIKIIRGYFIRKNGH